MKIGNIPHVNVVSVPVEKRTLQKLKEKYEFEIISPVNAARAMQERDEIILDCDLKGYHTEEDMEMIEFLWNIRNMCVQEILRKEGEQLEFNQRYGKFFEKR